ncbi:permease of the major facilitator superfamily [Mytilinidion resinicola]|uniref:Permease of the major facilitator superfamily n=1 Tax=Mytilinidion resinicola TaxID=574789 RepID=A0A6A6Y5F4_9PEZI|nr:permease of the major facilitator superfamily [Mytilinidion resinicola]KAF2803254.1 permease of the major facilitator superfamily [Mytilinidion resinicola]
MSESDKEAFLASFSAEDDKAIMRKVDRRFLLLIGLMYLIKNVDYANAASVKVLQVKQPSNIMKELHMTSDQYNWVQSIYFIAYIVFEVPSNLLLKKVTPRNWQTRIMLSWGIVLACHAAVKNKEGLYAARFILGMMEAGMFPGLAAQLCSWYRSDEMGKPIMWMFGFQNTSGIVGSLLAYGISYLNGKGGLSAWRWVYLIEGIFTIFFSAVVFLVLPDYPKSPRSRSWLTPREQQYLELRLSENAPLTHDSAFSKSEIWASLTDPRTYSFMLSQILLNLGGYGLSWQLPVITTNLGFAGLPRNQLLNIPPAGATVLSIIAAGWFMKRAWITRPAFIMFIMAGATTFFIVLATVRTPGVVYAACVLGTMFYSVYFIPFWAWRSSTLKGTTGTAFTLAFQSCVGQVGGVIGPQLFQERWAHNGYRASFAICATAIGVGWIANCWTWWLTRNVEWDVRRIRRLRIKAGRENRIFAEDDVKVYEERKFYGGLTKRGEEEVV